MSNGISVFYTTVPSQKSAEALAAKAIEHKVAACINIIPKLISFYVGNNTLERSDECGMLFKTSAHKENTLRQWLLDHHPYEEPAILYYQPESTETFQAYVHRALYDDTSGM